MIQVTASDFNSSGRKCDSVAPLKSVYFLHIPLRYPSRRVSCWNGLWGAL